MPSAASVTFAPAPWAWESSKVPGGRGGNNFNLYITDANGRKIAAVWGKPGEKEKTCKLIAAAPAMRKTLDEISAEAGMTTSDMRTEIERHQRIISLVQIAIALAENGPQP